MDTPETSIRRLQELLRELLQLDLADLDFGFYRLLRLQRDEIERFIDEQLPRAVDEAFEALGGAERADLEGRLEDLTERIRAEIADDALTPTGDIAEEYRSTKVRAAKDLLAEYQDVRARVGTVRTTEARRIEVFNHLYAFFARYYQDGDFIPVRRYGSRERYAVPYDGEETLLYWANQGQHYVKSSEVLRDYAFTVEGDLLADPCRVRFVLTQADVPVGDLKGDARFFFPLPGQVEWDDTARTLRIPFAYRPLTNDESQRFGRSGVQQTVLDESLDSLGAAIPDGAVRSALLPDSREPSEAPDDAFLPPLAAHLRRFVRRQTSDYFVHRDLSGFLERELEFYIKDQVLHLADLDGDLPAKLRMLRVLREISGHVITFLAQLEEVQKRLFEKRKFVLRTDYLVLIHAVPRDLWAEVLANDGQLREWERLFHIDPTKDLFNPEGEVNETFLEGHPTLVVNTALFDQDFRDRLLASFEDIEEATGGILVHSENYQALRLLEPRFRREIKCIYIDPPYNTGSDDFIYKDRYQHSSWLAMMSARLTLAHRLLRDTGSIFVSIDDTEVAAARTTLRRTFGSSNEVATIVWQKRYSRDNRPTFGTVHEYLLHFARSAQDYSAARNLLPPDEESLKVYRNPNGDPRGRWRPIPMTAQGHRPNQMYTITTPAGVQHQPPPGRCWGMLEEQFESLRDQGRIWFGADDRGQPNVIRYLDEVEGFVPWSWWPHEEAGHTDEAKKELYDVLGRGSPFETPKPTRLVIRAIQIASDPGDWILDFFAGSGTTGQAVVRQARAGEQAQRRFILVDLGAHFDSVLLERVTRGLYADDWSDGTPRAPDSTEGRFQQPLVRVIRLETYEDALHSLSTEVVQERQGSRATAVRGARGADEYRLRYVAKVPMEASDTLLDVEQLAYPFRYELEVLTDDGPRRQTVDLVETFNLVYGLRVRRMLRWVNGDDGDRPYRVVTGESHEGRSTLVVWRDMTDLDAAAERDFLLAEIGKLGGSPFDEILINGDTALPGARSLDPIFKARMEEGER